MPQASDRRAPDRPTHGDGARDAERTALHRRAQAGDFALDADQDEAWAQQCEFRLGSMPAVVGRSALRRFLDHLYAQRLFTSLSHRIGKRVETDDATAIEGVAVYTLDDCSTVEIPYASWTTYAREDGALKFDRYHVYIDLTPLYEAVARLWATNAHPCAGWCSEGEAHPPRAHR